jgi:hypothetical protein
MPVADTASSPSRMRPLTSPHASGEIPRGTRFATMSVSCSRDIPAAAAMVVVSIDPESGQRSTQTVPSGVVTVTTFSRASCPRNSSAAGAIRSTLAMAIRRSVARRAATSWPRARSSPCIPLLHETRFAARS